MSRFRLIAGTVCVVSLGCLVAALVQAQAQDTTQSWTAANGVRSSAPSHHPQAMDQYRPAGQAVSTSDAAGGVRGAGDSHGQSPIMQTAHQDPATMPGTDGAGGSSGLRSVLKRNTEPSSAPPATASTDATTSLLSEETASSSRGASEEPPAMAEETRQSVLGAPSSAAIPPAAARLAEDDDSLEARVSSRRTQRPHVPATTPGSVTARPIPTQQFDGAQPSSGMPAAVTDSPTTLSKAVGPALSVEIVGPTAALLGQESVFRVQLLNQGEVEAKGVTVRVGVPEGTQLVTAAAASGEARVESDRGANQIVWNLERLSTQAAGSLNLTVIPTTDRPIEFSVDWSVQPVVAAARVEVKQPLLELALRGPGEMVFGDTKVFSIVLSNPGSGDAKNVAVNVALGPNTSDTMRVGTIAAGTSKTFDFEVTARQTGTMQISATASGAGGLEQQAEHPVAVLRAELEVEASGPEMQYAGAAGSYGVRVANTGNASARNVQLLVRIPQGVRYLQGVGNVRQDPSGMVWQLGDLAPNTERVLGFDCELLTDGEMTFHVAARADGTVEASGEVLTRVETVADLKLSVNDPKGPIPVGQEVVYEINVVNRGTKAATQVIVVAQFSEGIEPVGTDGAPGEIQTGQVVFQPIARINPKETAKLMVKAKAQAGGNHVFRAALQCDDPETRLVAEYNTRFYGSGPARTTVNPAMASPSDRLDNAPQTGERPAGPNSVYRR